LTSSAGPGTLPQLHVPASVQLPVVLFGQVQIAVGRAATRDENDNHPINAANINSAPYSTVRFKDMLPPLEVELVNEVERGDKKIIAGYIGFTV
jgi:hypothetical protein